MSSSERLADVRILITAGPTREALDPVRYLSNRSSGKMGFAIARAARDAGAKVTVIAGPVDRRTPKGVWRVNVESAKEMQESVEEYLADTDIFIAAAAVADYRAAEIADRKIKKGGDTLTLELVRNPDILAQVADREDAPFTVGFAAETDNLVENARAKMFHKNLDMIAANQVGNGKAFDQDDNELTVIWKDGEHHLPRQEKTVLAKLLVALIAREYRTRRAQGARS